MACFCNLSQAQALIYTSPIDLWSPIRHILLVERPTPASFGNDVALDSGLDMSVTDIQCVLPRGEFICFS